MKIKLKKDEKISSNMNYMGLGYDNWVALNQGKEIELDAVPDKIKDQIEKDSVKKKENK